MKLSTKLELITQMVVHIDDLFKLSECFNLKELYAITYGTEASASRPFALLNLPTEKEQTIKLNIYELLKILHNASIIIDTTDKIIPEDKMQSAENNIDDLMKHLFFPVIAGEQIAIIATDLITDLDQIELLKDKSVTLFDLLEGSRKYLIELENYKSNLKQKK